MRGSYLRLVSSLGVMRKYLGCQFKLGFERMRRTVQLEGHKSLSRADYGQLALRADPFPIASEPS